MCWHSGEDVDHLLIHCEGAYWLWSYAFRSFGLSWVLPKRVVDVLAGGVIGWGSVRRVFGT